MIGLRSEKFGQSYRGKADHRSPAEKAPVANVSENAPSKVEAWRRTYMRAYMRRWRARSSGVGAPEPEKQPQVEENPAPRVKQWKPPPKGERKARWAARAEEMRTLAESMLMDEPRAMMKRLAQDYERMSEREE